MKTTIISFFLLLLLSAAVSAQKPAVETYEQLLQAIREVRHATQQRVEQEKVREAWETGNLINIHILHRGRAGYDQEVIPRLAKDLQASERELYYMLEFSRSYPILPTSAELTWSHYRELLALNDEGERRQIAERAEKEDWDVGRLRQNVLSINASHGSRNSAASEKLEAAPGKIGIYRIAKNTAGEWVMDLGFSNYWKPEKKLKFREGDLVALEKGKLKKSDEKENALYTYQAHVLEILDGDTFRAEIDLGFGFTTVQKLRLRGLDAPEIESAEGREAKEFLVKEFAKSHGRVVIKSVKSDKYDRYLADVWAGNTYLNQKLIDKGLAVKVSE